VEFDHFTVVLLLTPEDPPELSEDEANTLQDAHLAHLASLHEAGHLIAAGPLSDPERRLRGLSILSVEPERARELKEADPSVRAGVFALEIVPWLVPSGAISHSPTRFPHSIAEATGE
jgi:uncharacterized protein YciI